MLLLVIAGLVMAIGARRDGSTQRLTPHIGVSGRGGHYDILVDHTGHFATGDFVGGSITIQDVATYEVVGDRVIGRTRDPGVAKPWFAIQDEEIFRSPDAIQWFDRRDAAMTGGR